MFVKYHGTATLEGPSDLFLLKKPRKSLDFRLFNSILTNSGSHSCIEPIRPTSSSGLLLEILANVVGQKFGFHPSVLGCFAADSLLSGRGDPCGGTSSECRFELAAPVLRSLLLGATSSPDISVGDDLPPS